MTKTLTLALFSFLVFSAAAQDASSFYLEGLKLKDEKKSREAAEKFKRAIALKANYTEALYELGWCQNDIKEYTSALSNLRKARNGWPSIPKVYFELGYAFQKLDLLDSAKKCFNRCIELKPDYSGAWKQLGYLAWDNDNYEEALEKFAEFERVAKTPPAEYLYWYRKGFAYNATKEYEKAKTALLKSLDYKKDNLNTYLELGFSCTRLKQGDDAIAWFKKAQEVDPASHVSYNGIGEVYRDIKKNYDEAVSWYRKALNVKENERKACFGIGFCYNATGKYTDAIPYFKTALEQEPTYTAAFVELGYSYFKTDKLDDAITNLKRALELNPKNENARYYAVLVYVRQRNKQAAQRMVDELQALNSKYVAELQKKVDAM